MLSLLDTTTLPVNGCLCNLHHSKNEISVLESGRGIPLRRKLDCTAAGINLTATQRSGQGGTNASDFYRAFSPPTRSSNWPSPGLGHERKHLSYGPDSKPSHSPLGDCRLRLQLHCGSNSNSNKLSQ
jgi:hypothetical protein